MSEHRFAGEYLLSETAGSLDRIVFVVGACVRRFASAAV
jgi:hypothetical protein